jgi:hypothetical protein
LEETRNKCITKGNEFDVIKLPTKNILQENLRELFIDLMTWTLDAREKNATLQNNENLIKIKLIDGHATRNMIDL